MVSAAAIPTWLSALTGGLNSGVAWGMKRAAGATGVVQLGHEAIETPFTAPKDKPLVP